MGQDFAFVFHANQFNIDPTSKDIWTFTSAEWNHPTSGELYYRLFDSSGNAVGDGNNPTDFNPFVSSFGFVHRPTIEIDQYQCTSYISSLCVQPKSNQFQSLDANGNSASLSSTQQFITVIETENNSSDFTTLDSNGDSSISAGIHQSVGDVFFCM